MSDEQKQLMSSHENFNDLESWHYNRWPLIEPMRVSRSPTVREGNVALANARVSDT